MLEHYIGNAAFGQEDPPVEPQRAQKDAGMAGGTACTAAVVVVADLG